MWSDVTPECTYTEIFRPKQPNLLYLRLNSHGHSQKPIQLTQIYAVYFSILTPIPRFFDTNKPNLHYLRLKSHAHIQKPIKLPQNFKVECIQSEGKMFSQINFYWVGPLLSAVLFGCWPISTIYPIYILLSILQKTITKFFWDQTYTVAFIHPPTTTQSFLTSSRHNRMLKLGIKLNKKPNPNLKKKNL